MLIQSRAGERRLDPPHACTFGRGEGSDLLIGADPVDRSISRQSGMIAWEHDRWAIHNTGSRAFFLVEPGGEAEMVPDTDLSRPVIWNHTWIRVPGIEGDHALVLVVADDELPRAERGGDTGSSGARAGDPTFTEGTVTLTPNELRSVVAVYEGYLLLPPAYDPQPRSWRSAAARLRVEEGKVRADHRRVAQKVAAAGGPDGGGSRYRDALIGWLLARGVVVRDDVDLVV